MAAQSTKPACATALTLAALMLAALAFAAQPAMAQVGQPIAVSAEDADGPLDAPPLPEPLTRQAIRDVLSGLSDGQARELLLRELDRRVAAREAALTGAREPALGALLGDWAVALGRGWVSVIQATPTLPGSAAAAFDNFQAERGEASPWRVAGTLMLCLLAGLGAAFGVRRLTRRQETRLDSLSPASRHRPARWKCIAANFPELRQQLDGRDLDISGRSRSGASRTYSRSRRSPHQASVSLR